MKLFHSITSPFVRKVMVCAKELGLEGRLELHKSGAHPINRNAEIVVENPLGQVPTLISNEGLALYDSRVVCEYLDQLGGGGRMFPRDGSRWQALVEQSAGDGLLDAGLLCRYEALRPEDHRSSAWTGGQMEKIISALDQFEKWAPKFGDRVDIGTISIGCALGWFDFRFAGHDWRGGHPALAAWFKTFDARPSMAATRPSE